MVHPITDKRANCENGKRIISYVFVCDKYKDSQMRCCDGNHDVVDCPYFALTNALDQFNHGETAEADYDSLYNMSCKMGIDIAVITLLNNFEIYFDKLIAECL